jgi:tetratricopeptide (TPR) repeat protein
MDVASRVALAIGQRRLAMNLADRAVRLESDNFGYRSQRAFCLLANRETGEALELIESLASRPRRNAAEHDALGNLFSQVGEQSRALECFQQATAAAPDTAHHWLNCALCLQALGRMHDAERAFDRCITMDPTQGEAWLHRSRLRTQYEQRNHVQELQDELAKSCSDWRREMTLHYALAKELEDLERHSECFSHLRSGSRLRRSHMDHDPDADLQAMQLVMQVFDRDYLASGTDGHDSDEPIFIVGMPRTGTTLVERILGSHSQVFAAGELNNFAESLTALVLPMKPGSRSEFISSSAVVNSTELGRDYVNSTRPLTGHTPHFIDKLPLNFLYCGLIHRALPQARMVHLRRNPMDTCFAIYKTLFKQAYPFSYDLDELGNYFLAYRALMEHWHQVMPGQILDVDYETLVAQPEAQIRRLLEFCELSWEDACLAFHQNQAPSMTASLAQVRQPVYSSSIGKWHHYEQDLAGLKQLFEARGLAL